MRGACSMQDDGGVRQPPCEIGGHVATSAPPDACSEMQGNKRGGGAPGPQKGAGGRSHQEMHVFKSAPSKPRSCRRSLGTSTAVAGTKEVHRRLAPDEQVILRGGAPTHPQGNATLSVQLQVMLCQTSKAASAARRGERKKRQ